ncbi:MAG: thiamine pyrophosphate-dependent enzyme [Bacteroidia bacterium]|nr:thiamine pyrophosphate-dependent enzyme [Bacteroidia bacterium]MCX7764515.1 thiamine pyrophosphate-dependent enzyme [Bacteroidia bacterium]MDW8057982.1 thiamine pyrophosphate-dependent enzyme [Bacteroidia bacterium]
MVKTFSPALLREAYMYMCYTYHMARLYDEYREVAKYVHSTSRGHEAIQLAVGLLCEVEDFVYPYYRDEALLLAMGFSPYELMLQLLAKGADPFSGGRTYYNHASARRPDRPKIPHQSSATGMQAIPATGAAHGLLYLRQQGLRDEKGIVVCSLGDGAITEGEVSEAFQMAVLKKLPILYVVQDNGWAISASAEEIRAMDATEYARGFPGLTVFRVEDGSDFIECYTTAEKAFLHVRQGRGPALLYAQVPLLGHHTSGVRREWYRSPEEYAEALTREPRLKLRRYLEKAHPEIDLQAIEELARREVEAAFEQARQQSEPDPQSLTLHVLAPTPITQERGERSPHGAPEVLMVDAALHAIEEILAAHPEALFYGQDVGRRLGGVFREAATLAEKFGDHRVFNTPIQEAYIIGSCAGMAAVGCRPIVEIQFADYIWPGLNQLFTELSRAHYLSNGKWTIPAVIRVPCGAYLGGGPYHSSSVESVLTAIRGIKVVYPSNAADMKGLLKAAFYDPNPVVILEHKGLYWSKVPGTRAAKTPEPAPDYVVPIGKARWWHHASKEPALAVISYGMGVHWGLALVEEFPQQIALLDLRSLSPLDYEAVYEAVRRYHRILILTEEPPAHSFAQALAGWIAENAFEYLDAPPKVIGSAEVPAIPLSITLEKAYLPSPARIREAALALLRY